MELSNDLKNVFLETAQVLKNSDRRIFMARVVKALGVMSTNLLQCLFYSV
jgi:hypothetical protein